MRAKHRCDGRGCHPAAAIVVVKDAGQQGCVQQALLADAAFAKGQPAGLMPGPATPSRRAAVPARSSCVCTNQDCAG
jgi:hypothetical protein